MGIKIEKTANAYSVRGVRGTYQYVNSHNFSRLRYYPEGGGASELVCQVGIPGVMEPGHSDPDPDFRTAIAKHAAKLVSA